MAVRLIFISSSHNATRPEQDRSGRRDEGGNLARGTSSDRYTTVGTESITFDFLPIAGNVFEEYYFTFLLKWVAMCYQYIADTITQLT